MLITLTNEFHNTETRIQVKNGKVSNRAGRRAWSILCGMKGCICGGQLGERGAQYHNGHGVQIEIDWANDGGLPGNHSATVQVRDDL